ncbi:hypothetical protein EON65_48515 [archaeon]|nr:MAG: hypothetical protein EON65_48515 [archaeon]
MYFWLFNSSIYLDNLISCHREITWQDFQKTLLESGQVERIVVSNKNVAK